MRGRDPSSDVPDAPNPGGGPAPHYKKGGRARKNVSCEAGKSARRGDRPGRRLGGLMTPAIPRISDATPGMRRHLGMAGVRERGGHITAAERDALPTKDFALPGKGAGPEGKGSGSYPIDTEGRARSALARAKHNASPDEQATIRRKVRAKYPGMAVSG